MESSVALPSSSKSSKKFIDLCVGNPGLIEFVVETFSEKVATKPSPPSTVAIPSLGSSFVEDRNLHCEIPAKVIFTDSTKPTGNRDSFAEATTRQIHRLYPKQDPSPSSFPTPTNEGNFCSVTIPEEIYTQRLEIFKDSFLGRVSYENQRLPLKELKEKLQIIWEISENWRLTPLGRGFFNVFIANYADRRRIFSKKSWGLRPGSFRLSNWCPDFNPYNLSSSKAQVWVRFYELPFEYWDSAVIWALATSLGTPLRIDENTLNGEYGQFARVLIEIDFKSEVRDRILVKRKNHSSFTFVSIENAPEFCTHCAIVGHAWERCRHRLIEQSPVNKRSDKVWVTKVDNRVIKNPVVAHDDTTNLGVKGVGPENGGTTVGVGLIVPLTNSFNAIADHDMEADPLMPQLMEEDDSGEALVCKESTLSETKGNKVTTGVSSNLTSMKDREKERRLSLESYEQFLKDAAMEPTPKARKAAVSAPSKMKPIALCARPEDSPVRRALKMGSNLIVVSKEHSAAAAAMHFAATKEFTRLDSMKPP